MKTSFIHAAKTALFLLLLTGLFAACSSSTGADDDDEQEPVAIRVKLNNQTVLEKNNETQTTTGSLSLTNGTSTTFTVLFVDDLGAEFTPVPLDEHSIVLSGGASVVTFSNVNSDSAPFSFEVTAQNTGNATFQIVMNHVGAPEFTATDLPIVVTDPN